MQLKFREQWRGARQGLFLTDAKGMPTDPFMSCRSSETRMRSTHGGTRIGVLDGFLGVALGPWSGQALSRGLIRTRFASLVLPHRQATV